MMRQAAFIFDITPNYSEDNFILSSANEAAHGWIKKWPHWGNHRLANVTLIHGPKASGKTHLSHIWQTMAHALFLDVNNLSDIPLFGCFIIEDIERIKDEQTLLHLFNQIVEARGFLLLTSNLPAIQLPFTLPDLRSRLQAVHSESITPPDETLLAAFIAKQCADRQLRITPEIIHYLLPRIDRSFEAAFTLVDTIDRAAMQEKRDITIPFLRSLLND